MFQADDFHLQPLQRIEGHGDVEVSAEGAVLVIYYSYLEILLAAK